MEEDVNALTACDGVDARPDAGGEGAVEDGPHGAVDAEGGAGVDGEGDLASGCQSRQRRRDTERLSNQGVPAETIERFKETAAFDLRGRPTQLDR